MKTVFKPAFRRHAGFSLIELLVSIVIGLLALLFATRLLTGSEQNRQSALGGSDSMQNGMLALFSISADANQAGFGLNDAIVAGCNTTFYDTSGYALAPAKRGAADVHPLAAVVIESNATGADRVSFYSGSSVAGTATLRIMSDYSGGSRLDVDRKPYGFAPKDVLVAAPETPGGDCALAELSSDPEALGPGQPYVLVGSGSAYRFNSGQLNVNFPGGMSRVFNLGQAGSLSFHTWSVDGGFLRLRATDIDGASQTPSTVADNIVSLKAQYGFDTRTGTAFEPENGMQVSAWSPTMIDADGDGVIGSAGDYQHVAAVRLAVVARSKNPERPAAGATCNNPKPTAFAMAAPAGVAAVPVTVEVAVTGDPADWRCYRYRVFETVVPLRNAGWRPKP